MTRIYTEGDISSEDVDFARDLYERMARTEPRPEIIAWGALSAAVVRTRERDKVVDVLEKIISAESRMPGNNSIAGLVDEAKVIIAKLKGE